jgi:hypothetical protein
MLYRIDRPMLCMKTSRVLTEEVVALPVPGRSDRPGNKSTAAIRAHVVQEVIHARGAERALIGADARFKRVGWQRLIAILTGWSELEHAALFDDG